MKIVLDTHAHTIVSGHAYNTIREMAQMAKEKGLEAFALTEHAPQMPGTCHEFYFQNLHIVPREMYGVRLFMGVELNIMNEKGEVDLPESTLCQMDIAIASIHGPCYKGERTEEAITAAYLAAMENPLIHIIGHPDDGRYPVADKEYFYHCCITSHFLVFLGFSGFVSLCKFLLSGITWFIFA